MSLILKQETSSSVPTPALGKGTLFLDDANQLVVKNETGNLSVFPTIPFAGDTQILYNDSGAIAGSESFTFNNSSNVVTVSAISVTGTTNLGSVGNVTITGGTSGQYLQTNGSGTLSWADAGGGTSVTNDTTTNTSYYLTFADVTSGSLSNVFVSSTKSYFNPSTGQLNATDFNSLSDKKSKENIQPLTNAVNVILSINGVSFDWADGTGSSYGFIAQDIEPVLPYAVSTNNDGKKSVNYAAITPFLVETVKQQQEQINQLLIRVAQLEDDGK
jgi:hypothetical protein